MFYNIIYPMIRSPTVRWIRSRRFWTSTHESGLKKAKNTRQMLLFILKLPH